MTKIYVALLVGVSILFVGCGGAKRQVAPSFEIPQENDGYERVQTTNGISIHGMSGVYPKSYKDKKLGSGLFNHKFFDIANIIIKDVTEDIDKSIKIKIKTKSRNKKVLQVVKEGKKYFKRQKDFVVVDSKVTVPDVVLDIEEGQSVLFTIDFISSIFDSSGTATTIDVGYSIDEVASESVADWSTVKVQDRNNNTISFQVMKNSVSISEYYDGKKVGDGPVTNIKYTDADQYCFKKYNGYVTPIYIFEYALAQGSIKSPGNGISQEMISGFDDGNEMDQLLYRDGDIVKSNMQVEDSDFSEIVIFNFKSKRYTFKRDNFVSQSVTFRCAK